MLEAAIRDKWGKWLNRQTNIKLKYLQNTVRGSLEPASLQRQLSNTVAGTTDWRKIMLPTAMGNYYENNKMNTVAGRGITYIHMYIYSTLINGVPKYVKGRKYIICSWVWVHLCMYVPHMCHRLRHSSVETGEWEWGYTLVTLRFEAETKPQLKLWLSWILSLWLWLKVLHSTSTAPLRGCQPIMCDCYL